MSYDKELLQGMAVFELWSRGEDLRCPICDAELSTIPEGVPREGAPLAGCRETPPTSDNDRANLS